MEPSVIDIVEGPIDPAALAGAVSMPSAGATAVFIGTTRSPSSGREVRYLEYEAYRPMAIAKMGEIVAAARGRWRLLGVCAVHRTGRVDVGEPSVVIAVSSVHRPDAFEACRYIIDAVKKDVPIWKKEVTPEGHGWAEG